jgi:hypothetical protein
MAIMIGEDSREPDGGRRLPEKAGGSVEEGGWPRYATCQAPTSPITPMDYSLPRWQSSRSAASFCNYHDRFLNFNNYSTSSS